jgi:hypothetical protein
VVAAATDRPSSDPQAQLVFRITVPVTAENALRSSLCDRVSVVGSG